MRTNALPIGDAYGAPGEATGAFFDDDREIDPGTTSALRDVRDVADIAPEQRRGRGGPAEQQNPRDEPFEGVHAGTVARVPTVVHGLPPCAGIAPVGYGRPVTNPRGRAAAPRTSSFGEREQDRYRLLVEDLVATEEVTYADVARRLGIRKDHLARVLKGERRVSLDARRKAATALGISEQYFTDEKPLPWRDYQLAPRGDVVVRHADPAWLAEQLRDVYTALADGRRPIEEGYQLAVLVTTLPAFHHARRVIEAHDYASRRGEELGPTYDLAVQHLAIAVREILLNAPPTTPKRTRT